MDHEFLHTPARPNGAAIVLTHGAGANCRTQLLVAVAEALCAAGMVVMRTDLAFRRRKPFGPPSPAGAAQDRTGLRDALQRLRAMVAGPVYLGGHSYGGRQASMLAAEQPGIADGLLLLSYPLHPPAKPAQMRTAHFADLRTPAVFIHGTKDPFGTQAEMQSAISLIPARTQLIFVEGAGHDLKKGAFNLAGLADVVADRELRR
jgi:predicted alpha/beta-hydrolase family hydrolase